MWLCISRHMEVLELPSGHPLIRNVNLGAEPEWLCRWSAHAPQHSDARVTGPVRSIATRQAQARSTARVQRRSAPKPRLHFRQPFWSASRNTDTTLGRMPMSKLEAELYALTHRGNPADERFCADASRGASRVLELGSGYGRLIRSLLRGSRNSDTRKVWGVEREPWLLASAKRYLLQLKSEERTRVTLLAGDMREFNLGVTFDCVVLPYNVLYCLLNRRDLRACLNCVRRHLVPGGVLAFDVWAADRFHRNASAHSYQDDSSAILSIAHRSQIWDVFERTRLRRREQRLDVVYTYVSRERGTSVRIPIAQRYAPSTELRGMLESTGFRIKSVFGNFTRGRYRASSDHFVVSAH